MVEVSSREAVRQTSMVDTDEESKAGFGSCSVFDVFVRSADRLPFQVPLEPYLKEILIGLQTTPGHGEERAVDPQMRANWRHLKHVLKSNAMQHVLDCLFWIASGVIYKRVVEDALEDFQHRLAAAWYLVTLEVNNKVHNDIDARDWLLGTLPVVLVQAVYRLMVDAFPDDKSLLVHHADPLLEKLTRVVFYEVAGFQLNDETCRRARRQLFKKNVLDNPFVNQHESLKSQMRREMLENQSKKLCPLTFGSQQALPLEETQLEHVMMGREEERKKSQNSLSPSTDKMDLIGIVPEELSVDRYASVSQKGAELFQRHLEDLLPAHEEHEIDSPVVTVPTRSSSRQRDRLSFHISEKSPSKQAARRSSLLRGGQSPLRHGKGAGGGRKTQVMFGLQAQNAAREKREAEDRERRRREDLLKQRIVDDPLPPELCETSLDTTWVSPIADRLAPGERERQALRKRAAEAHQLKMAPPQQDMLPTIEKSASEPSLRIGRRRGNSNMRGDNEELPKLGQDGDGHGTGHVLSPVGGQTGFDKGGGQQAMRASARVVTEGSKTYYVEKEPAIMKNKGQVLQRLQDQLVQFNARSFGVYMKEYDIMTGDKKQRIDPVHMKGKELSYVKEMQDLVGGRGTSALKMYDSPLQKAKKSPAARGGKASAAGGGQAATGTPKS